MHLSDFGGCWECSTDKLLHLCSYLCHVASSWVPVKGLRLMSDGFVKWAKSHTGPALIPIAASGVIESWFGGFGVSLVTWGSIRSKRPGDPFRARDETPLTTTHAAPGLAGWCWCIDFCLLFQQPFGSFHDLFILCCWTGALKTSCQ